MNDLHDDAWQPLLNHLQRHRKLSEGNATDRQHLINWLKSHGPFQSFADLQSSLRKAKIKGINKGFRQEFIESLQPGVTRRPFLTSLGIASALSLVTGVHGLLQAEDSTVISPSVSLRGTLAAFQQQRKTIGQSVAMFVAEKEQDRKRLNDADCKQFLHALDMSNWLEAATWITASPYVRQIVKLAQGTHADVLITALRVLAQAWDYLLSTKSEWEDDYFVAYALGKLPALATDDASKSPIPDFDREAAEHTTAIYELASLFHALEIFNQRFQNPGRTQDQAPIRFTQGHNFSYAHLAEDLLNVELFSDDAPTVLVNWDAHADLSSPFENPRVPAQAPFDMLQSASNYAERTVISSSMSIAGWILPIAYQGLLSSSQSVSRIIWVVPKESQQTSRDYMEPYGEYSFVVGDWHLPNSKEEIAKQSATKLGEWNIPGNIEIRHHGDKRLLTSVTQHELLNNQRRCKLHIVDADELPQLNELVAGAQIALSVDADFAGTREPGIQPRRGQLPHYSLTDNKKEKDRHEALLARLTEFADVNRRRIRSVSIANSPNFTVDEATRKPVAKILEIVTGGVTSNQPDWIANELSRVAPSAVQGGPNVLGAALTTGGISGIALTGALLMRDRIRLRAVHSLLFSADA